LGSSRLQAVKLGAPYQYLLGAAFVCILCIVLRSVAPFFVLCVLCVLERGVLLPFLRSVPWILELAFALTLNKEVQTPTASF